MKEPMKNISKSEVLTLKNEVNYQDGQVVSKTLAQNDAVSAATAPPPGVGAPELSAST